MRSCTALCVCALTLYSCSTSTSTSEGDVTRAGVKVDRVGDRVGDAGGDDTAEGVQVVRRGTDDSRRRAENRGTP